MFGWNIRTHGSGELAFDDTIGEVSGMWQTDLCAADDPGMIISIMVDDALATADEITAAGGTVVMPPERLSEHGEVYGTFRDPAGNLLCFYQGPGS